MVSTAQDGTVRASAASDGAAPGGVARDDVDVVGRVGARERSVVASRTHEVHRGLGALLDASGRLDAGRVWSLGGESLSESIREVYALEARLAAVRSALLGQAERSDLPTWDATPTLAAWLRDRVGLAPAQARKHIALARGLEEHPTVAQALAGGAYPETSAAVIVDAVDALPTDLVDAGTRERAVVHLVGAARDHDTRTLARLGAHLDEVLDPEGADRRVAAQLDAVEARAARQTFLTLTHDEDRQITDGTFRIPLHAGVTLERMLESLTNPARPDPIPVVDPRTGRAIPAERRRGEALTQLVERVRPCDLPRSGGSTTSVMVTMALQTLHEGLSAADVDGYRLAPATARRLAAEHGVIPVVLGTRGEVLDLVRRARLFTPPQRRAMTVQQLGRCAVEDCDRPTSWAEAHHLQSWHQGGPTDLANGVLVCARHHTLADHPGYRTTVLAPGHIRLNRRE